MHAPHVTYLTSRCHLILKVCYASSYVCYALGFDSSGVGLYLFLLFFSLSLVLLLLTILASHLYFTGNVPRSA